MPLRWLAIATFAIALPAVAVHFEDVGRKATRSRTQAYKAPNPKLPKALQSLDYDQYRDIRFQPAKRCGARTFRSRSDVPPGLYYDQPVRLSEIVGGTAREIRFDPDFFDYGKNKVDPQAMRG
jgi:glucans biosynthesis protein